MKAIELPAGTVPGSPEAVALIAAQVHFVAPEEEEPAVEPVAVVASVVGINGGSAYDLVISGLEMMLDGFRELRDA